MNRFQRDDLYDCAQEIVDFEFDERVAAVFPDMIHRSVPGYATLLKLLSVVGSGFVTHAGLVYDLGCSLGAASLALYPQLPPDARIIALDRSDAMVSRFSALAAGQGMTRIHVEQCDILDYPLQSCDLVILNFTLQFIPPEQRDALLTRIYHALKHTGALLLAEKTRPLDERFRHWHEGFKAAQGYSDMAIAQKRESLENVMRTDAANDSEARLHRAGFQHTERYFQALQFCGWVAIK